MELAWLEDFLALAEHGNFSRAAEARNLTQPAFSRRIKALEAWVGAPLFDRADHPVTLTAAGESFRPAADETVRRLAQGRADAAAAQAGAVQTLRIAATHSLSQSFFPGWLRALEAKATLPAIRLQSHDMATCEQLLGSGAVDFLLCHQPPGTAQFDPRTYRTATVGSDRLLPVAKDKDLRLPGQPDARLPLLSYSEISGMGRAVADLLAARAAWLRPVFTSHQATVLKAMTMDGRGLAWLPESQVAEDLVEGRLHQAGDETWGIPLDICLVRARHRLSPSAEGFWKLV